MAEIGKGPAYLHVAARIKAHIADQRMKPDDELPPARDLEELFGTTSGVMRMALRELNYEGIIVTSQGKPPRVRRRPEKADLDRSPEYNELKQLICDLRTEVAALRGEVDEIRRFRTEAR